MSASASAAVTPSETATASATALIVDDEPDIRELIALSLGRIGLDTHTAANLDEARHLLERYAFDVCLTDMRLPDGNGLELVRHVQSACPELPIAVITAHGNLEAAVEAMKCGAFDFVSKPVDLARLRAIVTQAIDLSAQTTGKMSRAADGERGQRAVSSATSATHDNAGTAATAAAVNSGATSSGISGTIPTVIPGIAETPGTGDGREAPEGAPASARADAPSSLESLCGKAPARDDIALIGAERLIGRSAPMQELRRLIAKVARTNAPVWITGESGTGKELVARLIHENGPRAAAPFVAINCGAIPAELMESELFGHKRGSFTGALADNEGLFRRAEGGTLFLDEVAELPLQMQVKLLRAIQERSVRPVGASDEVAVDARVLSASHADLAAEVEAGRFRHDLYYRLNVISIRSPSLRERIDDIPALVRHVLSRRVTDDRSIPSLSPEAIERLERYRFPGNVRELENLLERAVAMSDAVVIGADDLVLRPDDPASPLDGVIERRVAGADDDERHGTGDGDERRRLLEALDAAHWNRKAAAATVGLTYRQFRYRLAQLDIKGPGGR